MNTENPATTTVSRPLETNNVLSKKNPEPQLQTETNFSVLPEKKVPETKRNDDHLESEPAKAIKASTISNIDDGDDENNDDDNKS